MLLDIRVLYPQNWFLNKVILFIFLNFFLAIVVILFFFIFDSFFYSYLFFNKDIINLYFFSPSSNLQIFGEVFYNYYYFWGYLLAFYLLLVLLVVITIILTYINVKYPFNLNKFLKRYYEK